ncbi:MAG: hypothetical protein ACKVQA_22100 [Burkholderiales bacterium]
MKITSLVFVLLCSIASASAEEELVLGSDAISTLVKGKRLSGERAGGGQVRMKFAEDGSLSVQDGHAVETGKWVVQGNKLCIQVAKWNFDGCGKVSKAGNLITQYFPAGDKAHITFGK